MKILVVEDDKKLSLAIRTRLQSFGYEAVAAEDAISAISMAVKHNPDLALVDINLPGGDGFTVLDRLSASNECKVMPTIMMTANRDDNLKQDALLHGACVFLEKPFGSTALLEAIETAANDLPSDGLNDRRVA